MRTRSRPLDTVRRKRSRRAIAAAALTLALLLGDAAALALPAAADGEQPPPTASGRSFSGWWRGDAVGYCGDVEGNYVFEIQMILWADNDYDLSPYGNTTTNVDGYWGGNSDQAVKEYKARRGLGSDGCVDGAMFNDIELGLYTVTRCYSPLGGGYGEYKWPSRSGTVYFTDNLLTDHATTWGTQVDNLGNWRQVDRTFNTRGGGCSK